MHSRLGSMTGWQSTHAHVLALSVGEMMNEKFRLGQRGHQLRHLRRFLFEALRRAAREGGVRDETGGGGMCQTLIKE